MAVTGIENTFNTYTNYKSRTQTNSSLSFSGAVNKASSNREITGTESVVDQFKKNHPQEASTVTGQVNAGKAFLKKSGAENISREDMSMEEYKQFFTDLMNSIPFDASQQNDIEIWNISEKGWEQMKNDPEYEAWVLGYTVQDRAVHIPFASMPGYSPNLHTEQFGASIEEHLGQSVPMSSSGKSASTSSDDEESWWEKRHRTLEEFLEDQEKKAQQRRAMAKSSSQQAQLLQMQVQMMGNTGFGQYFPDYLTSGYPAFLASAFLSGSIK